MIHSRQCLTRANVRYGWKAVISLRPLRQHLAPLNDVLQFLDDLGERPRQKIGLYREDPLSITPKNDLAQPEKVPACLDREALIGITVSPITIEPLAAKRYSLPLERRRPNQYSK